MNIKIAQKLYPITVFTITELIGLFVLCGVLEYILTEPFLYRTPFILSWIAIGLLIVSGQLQRKGVIGGPLIPIALFSLWSLAMFWKQEEWWPLCLLMAYITAFFLLRKHDFYVGRNVRGGAKLATVFALVIALVASYYKAAELPYRSGGRLTFYDMYDRYGNRNPEWKRKLNRRFRLRWFLGPSRYTDSRWEFVDEDGNTFMLGPYEDAKHFSEGVAAVALTKGEYYGEWIYVDRSGRQVVPGTYRDAYAFRKGQALVMDQDDVYKYIDRRGEVIPLSQVANPSSLIRER